MTPLPRPQGLTDAEAAELLARTAREWFAPKAQNDNPREGFLTTTQAAAYLGTTPRALRARIARSMITPDVWAHASGSREHLFRRETLDRIGK